MSEFSSSSSRRSKPPLLNRDIVNMDDNNNDDSIVESHNVLPTEDDEINREHLVGHNRTKAMGAVYNSFGGPTPTAMSVESFVNPAGHLSMLDNNKGDVGGILNLEKKDIKPDVLDLCIPNSDIEKSLVKKLRIPPRPYVVLPCNFITAYEPEEVIASLKNLFDNGFASVINYEYVDQDTSVDYEYVDHECGFNGVFVRGSKYCDFKVRIYQERSGLLIELQRLHKDSCGFTFKKIFEAIKFKLTKLPSPNTVAISPIFNNNDTSSNEFENMADFDFSSVDLSTTSQLTDEEINTSIKQVLAMMQESNDQSQLESCRILCDLSEENEIRKQMIDNGCIPALISTLSKTDKLLLQQHSVFALAQLSECHDCAEALVACGAIPLLMSFITNGPYKTAAMRRECARVIANTAMKNASIFRKSVSDEDFNVWALRIPTLEDATVKERSERAFSFINDAV